MTEKTPRELGFSFPAEYKPHAATWMGWPFDDAYWESYLSQARVDFARLVTAIASFEPVRLVCANQEAERSARGMLEASSNITFYRLNIDDIWFRDCAPLFVSTPGGELAATDWQFNGWGHKFRWQQDTLLPKQIAEILAVARFEVAIVMEGGALDINDQGVCLTTRQCLLHPNRNPGLSQQAIERYLRDYLGVKSFIWLHEGLEGDKTDGHVDTITRWVNAGTIISSVCEDKQDTNYAAMQENLSLLKALRQASGEPYEIIELPLPKKRLDLGDERLPLTYANFYIGNGFVLMPCYDDDNDDRALAILKNAFPERKVLALPSLGIISGGGSFHCVTQQQPKPYAR